MARLRPSYESGVLTNGPLVRVLEETAAERLGVRHAVATSSCTLGLVLALKAVGVRGGDLALRGSVVLPSFTFAASAHAVAWNGVAPIFAECDPDTFQVDVADAAARLSGAAALMGTHVFGAPCDAEALESLGERARIPVLFDAAHGFGATRGGRPVGGFGLAEVFSLTPTKLVVAGEGGIVATNDDGLAEAVRLGREYGNPGNYDSVFVGLNARMSELHAALALESLAGLDEHLAHRRELARCYREAFAAVPGLRTQRIDPGDESTYKDFTVAIDEEAFGLSRDRLVELLRGEGIETRCYFSPPVHRHTAYARDGIVDLPVTDAASRRVVSLPLHVEMTADDAGLVVETVESIQAHAGEIQVLADR